MLEFTVPDMTCDHCVARVTEAVRQVDPDAEIAIDLAAHKVQVQTREDRAAIAASLVDAGYAPD